MGMLDTRIYCVGLRKVSLCRLRALSNWSIDESGRFWEKAGLTPRLISMLDQRIMVSLSV